MATATESIITTKPKNNIQVSLAPAQNAIASLFLMAWADEMPGVAKWVTDTAVALTPEQAHTHRILFEGIVYAVYPDRNWPSFADYLNHLAAQPPTLLRDKVLIAYDTTGVEIEDVPSWEALLADFDTFFAYLHRRFPGMKINAEVEEVAHRLLNDPPRMQQLIIDHLQMMWDRHLAAEWEQTVSLLQASVSACNQLSLANFSNIEAARLITGHELQNGWEKVLTQAEQIIFVPSPHVGPYLNKMKGKVDGAKTLWLMFGARVPEGAAVYVPALSRSELLVRLNALADDTRLRMLRLLAEQGELCAPDIMQALALSQSATSRHIRQLSATGYVNERRREGAKCYSLNQARVEATWQALAQFLAGEPE